MRQIYSRRSQSEARRYEQLPSQSPETSPPAVGLQKVVSQPQTQALIPEITPMRRGRPTVQSQAATAAASAAAASKPASNSDPFAALDSKNFDVRSHAVDELSSKFPSLDEFSLLHEQNTKVTFPSESSQFPRPDPHEGLRKKVSDALADEVFSVAPRNPVSGPTSRSISPTTLHIGFALTSRGLKLGEGSRSVIVPVDIIFDLDVDMSASEV